MTLLWHLLHTQVTHWTSTTWAKQMASCTAKKNERMNVSNWSTTMIINTWIISHAVNTWCHGTDVCHNVYHDVNGSSYAEVSTTASLRSATMHLKVWDPQVLWGSGPNTSGSDSEVLGVWTPQSMRSSGTERLRPKHLWGAWSLNSSGSEKPSPKHCQVWGASSLNSSGSEKPSPKHRQVWGPSSFTTSGSEHMLSTVIPDYF